MASFCAIVQGHYKRWTGARNSTEQVTNTCLKGVLVAISIPIFTSQLEKAREATDLANIRAAYSELTADALSGDAVAEKTEGKIKINASTASAGVTTYTATVTLVQKVDGWTTTPDTIGGMSVTAGSTPKAGGSATITIKSDGTAATLAFSS